MSFSSGMQSFFGNDKNISGLSNMLAGIFGLSSDPYGAAQNQYSKYFKMGQGYQDPYLKAGTNALGDYQKRLGEMSDPTAFFNQLMSGYSESPYAKYQQDQSMKASTNMASANGLSGSTPMQLQAQQNAQNISSKDMDQFFKNVYGINSDYMSGENNLIQGGHESANQMMNLISQMMRLSGGAAFGQNKSQENSMNSLFGGIAELAPYALSFL